MITTTELYSKTNGGLDIILYFYPQAGEVIGKGNKPFKIRSTDDTPSAFIKEYKGVWRVTDFGRSETSLSPIDICMDEMDMKFNEAINFLANHFKIEGDYIKKEVNKAELRKRPAAENESDGHFYFEPNEEVFKHELEILGPNVEQDDCDSLGYISVKYYTQTKNGQTTITISNENYPIFIRKCPYKDAGGTLVYFYKIYQPLNPDKKWRFFYNGEKPRTYINGLHELKARYEKYRKEQESTKAYEKAMEDDKPFIYKKLPAAFICSGERDALCAHAFGYPPLWFNSEGYKLSEYEVSGIMKYVERIYQIPDIDATGVRLGIERALKHIEIYTLWLPEKLKSFRDQRGKPRKDFRDYCEIWPDKDQFVKLLNLAMPVRFWEYTEDKKGSKRLDINSDYVTYFLRCNGFASIEDKNSKTGKMFVHIQNGIVRKVKIDHVKGFLKKFVRDRYEPVEIRNIVNNSTRLSESNIDLEEVELNFEDYTPTSQFFFFPNIIWEVTGQQIKEHKPGSIDRSVWDEEVIKHKVKRLDSAFKITKNVQNKGEEDESVSWDIELNKKHSSNFLNYLTNASRIFWRKELEVDGELPEQLQEYSSKYKFAIDGPRLSEEEIAEQKLHLINKIFCLGYLLHRYKAENRAWCVLAMDNKISDTDESNGGSGKSFCFKAPRLFMKSITLSGRNPKLTDNTHIYQNVTEYTDYILVDDGGQYLDFNFFFDSVTGDIPVNPKFAPAYEIPFELAAKFCITTNYTLRKFDSSTERRILYAVFSDWYHQKTADNDYKETRTIYDDFGKQLFRENYTEEEWNADINFFVDCCQFYLSIIGQSIKIQPPMDNVIARNQRTEMTDIFLNWAEVYFSPGSPNCDKLIIRSDAQKDFENDTKQGKWTMHKFSKALRAYCRYAPHVLELDPVEFKNSQSRIIRKPHGKPVEMIYIRTKDELNYFDNNEDNHDNNTSNISDEPGGNEKLPF